MDHRVEVLRPLVGVVVADEDFAAAGTVHLDVAIGRVFLERAVVAKRDRAAGAVEELVAALVRGWIETKCLAREARGDHRLDEAEGRERILAAGLEHDRDFHRERGQPEGIHAGRIARKEDPEAVRLREEVHIKAVLADDAGVEELERQAAREAGDDGADVGHRGVDLAHVVSAQAVREAGHERERGRVVGGRLEAVAVAPREIAVEVELRGFLHIGDERLGRDRAQGGAGFFNLAEVAADETGVGDADLKGVAVAEGVRLHVEAAVGLAEAEDGNVDRGRHDGRARELREWARMNDQ